METTKKPKILVLLSRVPYPLDKGDKLRAYKQLEGLNKKFRVILVCLNTGVVSKSAQKQVESICEELHILQLSKLGILWRLLNNLNSNLPFQVAYFYSKKAQKQLDTIIETHLPQRFFVQLIRVAEYARKYTIFEKTIDYMDALSLGMERRKSEAPFYLKPWVKMEAKRLKTYEESIFNHFEKRIIISEQDRNQIEHKNSRDIKIIANGIANEYFDKLEHTKDHDLCFTGNMSYPPNVAASVFLAKEVMPLLATNSKLLISGKSPKSNVKRLANNNITVTGWVKDMRTSYARSRIFVAPMMLGSGLQNKLLEAMACGLPCITTQLANDSLGATPNQEILIANTAAEFAEHIKNLNNDLAFATKLGQAGQQYVLKHYSWDHWNSELEEVLLSKVGN